MSESQLILAAFVFGCVAGYFAGYGNAIYDQVRKRLKSEKEQSESQPKPPNFFIKVSPGGCNITWRNQDRAAYLAGMEDRQPQKVTVERVDKQ